MIQTMSNREKVHDFFENWLPENKPFKYRYINYLDPVKNHLRYKGYLIGSFNSIKHEDPRTTRLYQNYLFMCLKTLEAYKACGIKLNKINTESKDSLSL